MWSQEYLQKSLWVHKIYEDLCFSNESYCNLGDKEDDHCFALSPLLGNQLGVCKVQPIDYARLGMNGFTANRFTVNRIVNL